MSDIFREVDEALQKEKVERLWKEYGPVLLTGIVTLILATGAISAWRSWDYHQDRQGTQKLVEAASSSDDIALALEKAAEDLSGEHGAIALLTAAGDYAGKKDFTKAANLYEQAAQDTRSPQEFRDLARILHVRSALLSNQAQTDYQTYIDQLLPIAQNDKGVFQLQAKIETALLYGNGLKDYSSALKMLQGFDGNSVDGSLKEKATALRHVYEYEQGKSAKTTEGSAS